MDKLGGLVIMFCSLWGRNPDSFERIQCKFAVHRRLYTDGGLLW